MIAPLSTSTSPVSVSTSPVSAPTSPLTIQTTFAKKQGQILLNSPEGRAMAAFISARAEAHVKTPPPPKLSL